MNFDSPNTADIVERLLAPVDPDADPRRYPRNPDGPEAAAIITELRSCAVELATTLQLLIERHGEHLPEGAGEDIRRADFALGKLTAALKDHRKAQTHDRH